MTYFTPRNPTARNYGRSSAVTITRKTLNEIPWAEGYTAYQEAANMWEETAQAAHESLADASYAHFIKQKEADYESVNPEGGAYEGNATDSNPQQPYKPLPNRTSGRRKAGQKAFVEWLTAKKFGDLSTSVLPEMITLVGNLPYKLNENGLISGKSLLQSFSKTPTMLGIYVFLMLDSRSCYLDKQYKGTARPYSSLVPLILYAIRLVKGVPYTAWDPEEIRSVVNHDLAEAMLFDMPEDQWPTKDEILEGRQQGLTFASGPNTGKVRSAITSHKLYATTGTCFEKTPSLFQVMLSQIWVAHPENRTKYMVLDPIDWDKVPAPLIEIEVFSPFDHQNDSQETYDGIL